MRATSSRSFPCDSLPRPEHGTGRGQKSRSNVFDHGGGGGAALSGLPALAISVSALAMSPAHTRARLLARPVPPILSAPEFRVWFAPVFAAFLRANFASPEVVAAQFGVRFQTAVNWWNSDHRASGDTVALAFLSFPDAVTWFLQEWEARR